MSEYDDKLPLGLSEEEKSALIWKIEQDYERSNMGAAAFKDEYLTFAINFYTRAAYSMEDIIAQHKAYSMAERQKTLSDAFLTDIKSRLRARELAHN